MPFCHLSLQGRRPPPKGYPTELLSLGDHIRAKRLDLGLYQKQAADLIGVSESNIWNWENNRCQPEIRFVPGIIDFLGYAPYTPKLSFPEWLKMARAASGLTQEQLAQALGVDESTVLKWERGRNRPTQKSLQRIGVFVADGETRRT